MTNHTPEVQALINAAKTVRDSVAAAGRTGDKNILDDALAKLEPKPEKVYVLPEYGLSMPSAINAWLSYHTVGQSKWHELRELTATDAPAQK